MKTVRALLMGIMFAPLALAQSPSPTPVAAYINSGSGWNPWTSAQGFGAANFSPIQVALFCQASAGGQWTPCNPGSQGALLSVNNLSDVASVSAAQSNLGLGTIATQNSNSVSVTGGSINGTSLGVSTPAAVVGTTVRGTTSIQIASGTALTSQSSSNSQAVTCPTGGSGAQYCSASGAWTLPSIPIATTTASIGGSLLSLGCTNQSPMTVSGATTSMVCVMSGVAGNPANIEPQCSVSAANTVTPQLCTAVAVTPTAQTYNIRVIP